MDGYYVYQEYCGLKAHFNNKYNYLKYGKVRAKRATYERRKDKAFFERLAKKNMSYIIPFLVANFVSNHNLWIGDLVINKEAEDTYFQWKKKMSRLFMEATNEMSKVACFMKARDITFNRLFVVKEDEQPIIFRLMTQRFISLETYVIMDLALDFIPSFDQELDDDIIYKQWSDKVAAYKPFLQLPKEKCLIYVRKAFLSDS